jgi:acetyltransferase-like isoleucine patch superfamily enzyme
MDTVRLGTDVKIPFPDLVNLYGCEIGDESFIGPFVEVQRNASVGKRSRVQSHSFVCEGVHIGDDAFVGHGVMFINDRDPKANNTEWTLEETHVEDGASIGSGAVIMCGVRLGEGCRIGAGAVVTRNVPAGETVVGVPARTLA